MSEREELQRRRRIREAKRRRKRRNIKIIAAVVLLCIAAVLLCIAIKISGVLPDSTEPAASPEISAAEQTLIPSAEPSAEPTIAPTPEPTPTPPSTRGTSQAIPAEVQAVMSGKSMKPNNNIGYADLAYLTVPHYDFGYNIVEGHLVVNKAVAEDLLDIFEELLAARYPIERMELVDYYDADDYTSIDHNNTSAFNYRESTDGSGRLSRHALGRAIDINPQQNPYVNLSGTGAHPNAREFWSRDVSKWTREIDRAAFIGPGTEIYRIFTAHGWEWGGAWSSYRDYQHFQK